MPAAIRTQRQSPWRSIWLQPEATVRKIAHDNSMHGVFAIPILAGLATWPALVLFSNPERLDPVSGSLVSFGSVAEVLQVFVGAWLLQSTGQWLGGHASAAQLRVLIAWANIPIVVMFVLALAAMGISVIYEGLIGEPMQLMASVVTMTIGIAFIALQIFLCLWSFVIFFRGLAGIQRFGIGRAVANALISWLPLAILLTMAVATTDIFNTGSWLQNFGLNS